MWTEDEIEPTTIIYDAAYDAVIAAITEYNNMSIDRTVKVLISIKDGYRTIRVVDSVYSYITVVTVGYESRSTYGSLPKWNTVLSNTVILDKIKDAVISTPYLAKINNIR